MTDLVPAVPKNAPPEAHVVDLLETAPQVTPAALLHMQAVQTLLAHTAARAIGNGLIALTLAPQTANPQTWRDLGQMQDAVVKRLQLQQQSWAQGCNALLQEYIQLNNASTLPKMVERQFNLTVQWGFLVSNQITNLMELEENIEVDYAYWASQKLQEQSP